MRNYDFILNGLQVYNFGEYFTIGVKDSKTTTTKSDLEDNLQDAIKDALENMSDNDALELINEYNDSNGYDTIYEMDENGINDALDGYSPWDVINMEIDTSDYYFTWDGYDINTFNDVWENVSIDELTDWIIRNEYRDNTDIDMIYDDFEEACEFIDELEEEYENKKQARENVIAQLRNYIDILENDENTDILTLHQIAGDIIANTEVITKVNQEVKTI